MTNEENISFQIISNVGTATSNYVEAIRLAKEGKIEEAKDKVKEGNQIFVEGHKVHMELLTQECSGDPVKLGLLLVHAEDQLSKAEILEIMANEFIDLCEKKFN